MDGFNGLGMHLGNLSRLSTAKTRSISMENPTGEKGKGGMAVPEGEGHCSRDLGQGWKVRPCTVVAPGETHVMAGIDGPGAIQHIWVVPAGSQWRYNIIRIYWDDEETPSIEAPLGDFFAHAYGPDTVQLLSSLVVCTNPKTALNCYWEMPFRKKCRITFENISTVNISLFYQIDYTLTDIPDDAAYLHAQFRRSNPLRYKTPHTILDGVSGRGQYVGTYMAWGVNNCGWWGEGEIKFFLDGDGEFPTICGTGTEDYFCGSYNWDIGGTYQEYCTPYAGMPLIIRPDGLYSSQQRFSLYRWHIMDPVRFEEDIRITIQALGWRSEGRYLPLQDDISSTAFWYQAEPHAQYPTLPDKDGLEIV